MHLDAVASALLTLFLLLTSPVVAVAANLEDSSAPAGHFVVKLHRQRVPVKGQSDALSYKNVYFGTIYLGDPKQEFSVVFDTGSGHVVVPSTDCTSGTCRIHRRYDRLASPGAVDVDADGTLVVPGTPRDQVTVAYGTGEITGPFVSDVLCLNDRPPTVVEGVRTLDAIAQNLRSSTAKKESSKGDSPSSLIKQADDCLSIRIIAATEMTHDPFHAFSFDGILGLGLEALTLEPEFSFFGQMIAQGKVAKSIFSVFLADSEDEQSEICFGDYLPKRLQSNLSWSPVALPELGHWQVQIHRIRVGNKTLDFCNDGQCRAVVDTGTSLLAVPEIFAGPLEDELSKHLHDPPSKASESSAEHVIDCMRAEGALLHFDIEGLTVSLSAGDYARPAVMAQDTVREDAKSKESVGSLGNAPHDLDAKMAQAKCQPTIMGIDMPAPIGPKLFIWGEPVLRKFHTVYDVAEKKIGFGLAAHRAPRVQRSSSPRRPLLTV